jgi:hypothetical protein
VRFIMNNRSKFIKIIGLSGVVFALVGCPPTRAPDRPVPIEEPDDCTAGCDRMQELECNDVLDELKNAAEDVNTCDEACRHLVESGTIVGVACWKTIETCSDLDSKCG